MSQSDIDHLLRVDGELNITGGPHDAPLSVTIGTRRGKKTIEISVSIEEHTEWVISLDPAAAAYLAGALSGLVGVKFG